MINRKLSSGYTLIELVLVIVIAGILASIAAPMFSDATVIEDRGTFEEILSAVRYAQKHAMVSGCDVAVDINRVIRTGDSNVYTVYSIGQWASCQPANHNDPTNDPIIAIINPANSMPFTTVAPSGNNPTVVSLATIYFNNRGFPVTNGWVIYKPMSRSLFKVFPTYGRKSC